MQKVEWIAGIVRQQAAVDDGHHVKNGYQCTRCRPRNRSLTTLYFKEGM